MKLLALESANTECSVALCDAEQVLFYAVDERAKAQTQSILPLIEQALTQTQSTWADIAGIAFSRGPGSFSGVRINAAVAQALAWANDLPVVAVSTLQALAQAAYNKHITSAGQPLYNISTTINTIDATDTSVPKQRFTAVLDARMQELYIGHFESDAQGIMQLQGQEHLLAYAAAGEYATQFAHSILVGSGAALLSDSLQNQQPQNQQAMIHLQGNATHIAQIAYPDLVQGLGVTPELALPVYLRDNAWKKIAEQGKARG